MHNITKNLIEDSNLVIYFTDHSLPYIDEFISNYAIVYSKDPHEEGVVVEPSSLLGILTFRSKVAIYDPFNHQVIANYHSSRVVLNDNYIVVSNDCKVLCSLIIKRTVYKDNILFVVTHSNVDRISSGEVVSPSEVMQLLKHPFLEVALLAGEYITRNFDHVERR